MTTLTPSLPAFEQFQLFESHPPTALSYLDFFDGEHEPFPFLNELVQFAGCLFEPDDIVEIRLFPSRASLPKGWKLEIESTVKQFALNRFPRASEIGKQANLLAQLNREATLAFSQTDGTGRKFFNRPNSSLGVYFGVNPRKQVGDTKKEGVKLARVLFVDIDHVSIDEALSRLEESKLPQPTATVSSGHGVHFYWRLIEPITDFELLESLLKRLAALLNADPNPHDLPRVMRLPGFENRKTQDIELCYLIDCDSERRYEVSEIESLLPNPTVPKRSLPTTTNLSIQGSTAGTRSASGLQAAKDFIAKAEKVTDNRNPHEFKIACNLVQNFGLEEDEVGQLLLEYNSSLQEPKPESEVLRIAHNASNLIKRKGKNGLGSIARFEPYSPPAKDTVSLEVWRQQMVKARIESLKQPALYLDRSPPGAGKSTADIEAIKQVDRSLTLAPTHDACKQVVSDLLKANLNAAAYPELNAETCQQWGTDNEPGIAQLTQKAGLNVGTSVCSDGCPFFKSCVYQKEREKARNAKHLVTTHTRARLSGFRDAPERNAIFIHENATDLLAPSLQISQKDVSKIESLRLVAKRAGLIALSWNDSKAISFAESLVHACEELIGILKVGHHARMVRTSSKNLLFVNRLLAITKINLPDNLDVLLKRSMVKSDDWVDGNILKFVLNWLSSDSSSFFSVIEEGLPLNGQIPLSLSLLCVTKTKLPESKVIWFEDGSANKQILEKLTGGNLIDKTPNGSLEMVVQPVQYTDVDVTKQTGAKTVSAVIRGLLAQNPDCVSVGIICHKVHSTAIKQLDQPWKSRISRVEWFGSGKDRASNSWLDCDLIIVLGTPRVSRNTIRQLLIKVNSPSASLSANYSNIVWEGLAVNSNVLQVKGSGYADDDWQTANCQFVKESLRQAIGRGRGVNSGGVKVIAVSNENLGLLLATSPTPKISDSLHHTLLAYCNVIAPVSDISPKNIYIAQMSVSDRQQRRLVTQLITLGLLTRKGARGKPFPTDKMLLILKTNKQSRSINNNRDKSQSDDEQAEGQ